MNASMSAPDPPLCDLQYTRLVGLRRSLASDPIRIRQRNDWVELLLEGSGNTRISDLLDATARRYKELTQPEPPAFFLYIDQGEELYTRADEDQQRKKGEGD